MKSLALTITLSLLSILFATLATSEIFYLVIVTYIATMLIGFILCSGHFSKRTNDIGWGIVFGSLIPSFLLILFFAFS